MSFLESNSLHSGGARVACKKPRDTASARVLSVKVRKDRGPADASRSMVRYGNAPPLEAEFIRVAIAGQYSTTDPGGARRRVMKCCGYRCTACRSQSYKFTAIFLACERIGKATTEP